MDIPDLAQLMRDGEYLLLYPLTLGEQFLQISAISYVIFGFVAFIFFSWSFVAWRISVKKSKPDEPDNETKISHQTTGEAVVKLSPGGFGKVVDKDNVLTEGKKYKYFTIKDNTNQPEKLPVDTIVAILKKSAKEAHVRRATPDEIKKIKKMGIAL